MKSKASISENRNSVMIASLKGDSNLTQYFQYLQHFMLPKNSLLYQNSSNTHNRKLYGRRETYVNG